jgi:hypothetical protein
MTGEHKEYLDPHLADVHRQHYLSARRDWITSDRVAAIATVLDLEEGSFARCAGAWLVRHNPLLAPSPNSDALLAAVLAARQEEELCDAWQRLGALSTLRAFSRRKHDLPPFPHDFGGDRPATLLIEAGEVRWRNIRLGSLDTLFFQALPQEAQTRVTYETFGYRYLRWLEQQYGVLVLSDATAIIHLFVPDGVSQPDLTVAWPRFVHHAFSLEELQQTFVLLLNSVLLSGRGFSVPALPIVTQDQADVLLALLLATLQSREQDIRRREHRLKQLRADLAELSHPSENLSKNEGAREKQRAKMQKELEEGQAYLLTLHSRYDPALSRLHTLLLHLRANDAERAHRLQRLAQSYTSRATHQLKVTGAVFSKMVDRIEEWLALSPDTWFLPPPILGRELPHEHLRTASDSAQGVCYGCGSVIPALDKRRKVEYTANKLILRDPSQTLQSRPPKRMLGQVQPEVCGRCAVLSLTCPVKLVETGLVVSLREVPVRPSPSSQATARQAHYLYEHRLRALAVGEVLTTAGRYLMIPCTERAPDARPRLLIERMGRMEYALLKVASLFPGDVLERFQVEAFLGVDLVILSSRHLLVLRLFLEVFAIRPEAFGSEQAQSRYIALADAIRYVERDQVVFALYRLLGAFLTQPRYSFVQRLRLEDGFTLYEEQLRMDGELTIAQRFRDVAGLTGILYAFISHARKQLQNAAQQSSSSRDPERELKKLIEQVDHPLHFTYESAGLSLDRMHSSGVRLRRISSTMKPDACLKRRPASRSRSESSPRRR